MEIDAEIERLFSKKFSVSYFEKPAKVEYGNMNFSLYEIIIQGKPIDGKIKTDRTIAYAEISHITIQTEDKMVLDLRDKNYQLTLVVDEPLYIIKCIFIAFRLFFPCDDVFSFFTIKNEPKLPLETVKKEVSEFSILTQSPCNNFSFGIKFFAKYKYLPENDEIIWDIDTVYANKETRMFVLKDFDHLKPKYLMPVLGAMCYNTYFNELYLSNVDLTPYEKIIERVFKFNKKFRKLNFDNCNLKLPLCSVIASGLEGQKNLTDLDLSNNEGIGEKGVEIFSSFLKKSSNNLEVLKMSRCSLNSVSLSKIADTFTFNIKDNDDSSIKLRVLDLSNNPVKDNFKEIFFDFLSKCSRLEDLNLANMNCSIEMIGKYLLNGPVKSLKYIDLSENISPFSQMSCTQWSNFFKEAKALIRINFSNFKSLHCSITDGLMLGLEENTTISFSGVEVLISNSNFNGDPFSKFCDFIYKARSVTHLDFSSNGIGTELNNLLIRLPEFTSLKSLNISNNFITLKSKEQQNILSKLTSALQLESVNLQELYMSNCNFGNSLSSFINDIDSLFSLRVLDISGNNIGNVMARTLGRMLTIDKHIKEIMMDNNNICKEIYEEILDGLRENYTLRVFHVPFADLVKYPPKIVIPIIEKINKHHMKVNKIYQGVSFEDIKAMAFSCLMNQTSESVEKCKTILQESCNRLKAISTDNEELGIQIAKCLKTSLENIKSTEASKDLIARLNSIYKNNDDVSLLTDFRIKKIIDKVSSDVSRLINEYMLEVTQEMLNELGQIVPFVMKNNEELHQELKDICKKVTEIPQEYLSKLFSHFIENNLLKKVYETQSNVSNAICDRIIDHIITDMNICDMDANKLINSSKTVHSCNKVIEEEVLLEDHEKPVIRCTDDKKVERDKMTNVRTSRLSHLAASKSRPISKALKTISSEEEDHLPPPKPTKPSREKPLLLKPSNINFSSNIEDVVTPEESSPKSFDLSPNSIKPIAPSRKKQLPTVTETAHHKNGSQESLTEKTSQNNITNISRSLNLKLSSQDSPNTYPQQLSVAKNVTRPIPKLIVPSSADDSVRDSISEKEVDFVGTFKNRPKPTKNVKPKVVTPTLPNVENGPITNDNYEQFLNFTEPETEKNSKVANKKKSFFSLSKNKMQVKSKLKNIDLNDLGSENISTSDSDPEVKESTKSFKKQFSLDTQKTKRL